MSCQLAQTTVHGYFDAELDAERSAEFEQHLETCAECRAAYEGITQLSSLFQENDLYVHASPEMRARVRKQLERNMDNARTTTVSRRRWFLAPVFAVVVISAISAIAWFQFRSHTDAARVTAELIDAHVRSLQPGHLTDVQSTDQHTVKPWFDGKLDFIPPVSDYSSQGFPLLGGRLDVVGGRNVAALVYSRRKHLINLFIWPAANTGMSLRDSGSRQGYNWMTWKSGDMQLCLISDVSDSDLRELEALINH